MTITKPVGIVAYGASLPQWAIQVSEIEKYHNCMEDLDVGERNSQLETLSEFESELGVVGRSLMVKQKTVPDLDEDAITLSIEAGFQALSRASSVIKSKFADTDPGSNSKKRQSQAEAIIQQSSAKEFGRYIPVEALFIGSESHPYAVKPSGTVVAQALGLGSLSRKLETSRELSVVSKESDCEQSVSRRLAMADLQFACKAGTQAMQICASYVLSGMAKMGLAIGSDTAQAQPGDALEYTASAGAAAYLIGSDQLVARLLATTSVATDTPDFWRRANQPYPQHAGRFTGKPAYSSHIKLATEEILLELKKSDLNIKEIDHCVFHTPNGKFPRRIAKQLGFSNDQLVSSLIVEQIGNTYAAAVPLALAAALDQAQVDQKILVVSYGSGAGADAFLFETTAELVRQRKSWSKLVADQISLLKNIDITKYLHLRNNRSH